MRPSVISAADGREPRLPHISVCICTFRRREMLRRLLQDLGNQTTEGEFSYSVVIVDNDRKETARDVVEEFASASGIPTKYFVEPRQNIARARNKSVREASGDFVAFIDDDEFPAQEWLLLLLKACSAEATSGVLGPVLPHFRPEAPRWVIDGGFYDRPRHPTGMTLNWSQTRTGNALLKHELFAEDENPFNPECLEGSDQEFFRRMMGRGHVFVWCDEAVVFEDVPPARWTRSFLIRRATFRGVFAVRNHALALKPIVISLLAAPAYAALLPVGLIAGQAVFMKYVFKFCYHLGRLLGLIGINPIRKPYVTE